jgi:hypothetical protein
VRLAAQDNAKRDFDPQVGQVGVQAASAAFASLSRRVNGFGDSAKRLSARLRR